MFDFALRSAQNCMYEIDFSFMDSTINMFLQFKELSKCSLDVISEGHLSYRHSWSWTIANSKWGQLWLYLLEWGKPLWKEISQHFEANCSSAMLVF